MENQKEAFDKNWEKELIYRIDQIEQGDSDIKHMTKKDYMTVGVIVFICLCALVAGAFLSA